jgi:hypothetical protein
MDQSEKRRMMAELEKGRRELMEALGGVTEEAATRSSGPGRWSLLGCVEHVAVVEHYHFGTIEASHAAKAPEKIRAALGH